MCKYGSKVILLADYCREWRQLWKWVLKEMELENIYWWMINKKLEKYKTLKNKEMTWNLEEGETETSGKQE